jgi:prepilin-type N-terminal cleavage/methylation domain-containing protein/prepilin-type processing-associated H-X9-DG protein
MNRRGFTLIELLVVIAVIAVLIGVLLPALGKARDSGRGVVCMANQRSVVMAQAVYEADHKGWLVGPNTTGSDLENGKPYVDGNSTPVQDWDFVSPLLGEGLRFPTDQVGKFEMILQNKFRCPSNTLRYSVRFSGPALSIEKKGEKPFVMSYMTPAYFHMYPTGIASVGGKKVESVPSGEPVDLPKGYQPRIDKVGTLPGKKIMSFEGSRYYNVTANNFDYTTDANTSGLVGSPQGIFGSRGSAFRGSGEPYDREVPGGAAKAILKKVSLRHSGKMNAGMFDGHVEMMDNEQSSNPSFYTPSGTILKTPSQSWYFFAGPSGSPLKEKNAVLQ